MSSQSDSTPGTDTNALLKKYFTDYSFVDLLSLGVKLSGDTSDENKANDHAKKVKNIIGCIEAMMADNASSITYTQIRNVLQIVKKKEYEKDISGFFKTLPKIAYIEARLTPENRPLMNFIRMLATEVNSPEDYKGFIEMMNAITAYHKLYQKSNQS